MDILPHIFLSCNILIMKNFSVTYYVENHEEVDFVTYDFDAEDLESLRYRLKDSGDISKRWWRHFYTQHLAPDESTSLDDITDWGYFYIEDSDGNSVFCNNNDYLELLLKDEQTFINKLIKKNTTNPVVVHQSKKS